MGGGDQDDSDEVVFPSEHGNGLLEDPCTGDHCSQSLVSLSPYNIAPPILLHHSLYAGARLRW